MEYDDRRRRLDSGSFSRRSGTGSAVYPVEMGGAPPQQPRARPVRRWFPWLLPSFVVANSLVFVVTMAVNNCPENTGNCVFKSLGKFSFQPLKENPLLGPSSTTLLKMGALDVKRIVDENQGWRIISCMWLHAGVFHLLANMIGLLFFAIQLEQDYGFVRIGLLYVIAGVGGSLLSALFIENGISVGASGALFGLLGAMLSELITNWTIYEKKFAEFTALVFFISINLGIGLHPYVDNFAHIGGFVSGFLLGFVFLIRPRFGYVSQKNLPLTHHSCLATRKHKMYQYVLWALAMVLLLIGFIVGFILLFRGVNANDRCSWCHYLNCVPIWWSCKQKNITCHITTDQFEVNLTCGGTEKTRSYAGNLTSAQIDSYCTQLCS